jgi:hypothetical protein
MVWVGFNSKVMWEAAWIALKGIVFWIVILLGLLFILLAISDMKE